MKLIGYVRSASGELQARVQGENGEIHTVAPSSLAPRAPAPSTDRDRELSIQERVLSLHEKRDALAVQLVENETKEFIKRLEGFGELHKNITETQAKIQTAFKELSAEVARAVEQITLSATAAHTDGAAKIALSVAAAVQASLQLMQGEVDAAAQNTRASVQSVVLGVKEQTARVVDVVSALRDTLTLPREIESTPIRDAKGRVEKILSVVRVLRAE